MSLGALLFSACAPPPAAVDATTPLPPPCEGSPGGRVGECPGDFTLPTPDGPFTLSDHAGGMVVVVHLSGDTALDGPASQFIDVQIGSDVLAVDVLTDAPASSADAEAWRSQLSLSYPVAFDEGGSFGEDWGRTGLYPTLLVLDRTHAVAGRIHEQFETQLPGVLAELAGD